MQKNGIGQRGRHGLTPHAPPRAGGCAFENIRGAKPVWTQKTSCSPSCDSVHSSPLCGCTFPGLASDLPSLYSFNRALSSGHMTASDAAASVSYCEPQKGCEDAVVFGTFADRAELHLPCTAYLWMSHQTVSLVPNSGLFSGVGDSKQTQNHYRKSTRFGANFYNDPTLTPCSKQPDPGGDCFDCSICWHAAGVRSRPYPGLCGRTGVRQAPVHDAGRDETSCRRSLCGTLQAHQRTFGARDHVAVQTRVSTRLPVRCYVWPVGC